MKTLLLILLTTSALAADLKPNAFAAMVSGTTDEV